MGIVLFVPQLLKIGEANSKFRFAFILVAGGLIVVGGLLGYLHYNISVADHYYATGQFEKGLSMYLQLAKIDGNSPTLLNGIAYGQFQTGDYEAADQSAKQSLAERPDNNYDATMIKAWVEATRGQQVEAIATLDTIASADLVGSYVFFEIAMLENELGHLDQAVDALKQAIEYNPEYLSAYVSLADLYSTQSRYSDTAAVYQSLIAAELANPGQTVTESRAIFEYNKGVAFYYAGQYQEAIEGFNESFAISPSGDALYYLASCYVLADDNDAAIQTLTDLLERDPTTIAFIETDIDFNVLYELPEYQALLAKYR